MARSGEYISQILLPRVCFNHMDELYLPLVYVLRIPGFILFMGGRHDDQLLPLCRELGIEEVEDGSGYY